MSAPHAWHQRGRALELLGRTAKAYDAFTTAYTAAKATGWRRDFWAIAADLAELAATRGDAGTAHTYRQEAIEGAKFIAAHAPAAELRDSFLAQPHVRRLLEG